MPLNIPKYWARAEVHGALRWGWSSSSEEEARSIAHTGARDLARRIAQGLLVRDASAEYGYGNRPFREECLETIPGPAGEPSALLTRSTCGTTVLNTASVMFVDIDLPQRSAQAGTVSASISPFAALVRWISGAKEEVHEGHSDSGPRNEIHSRVRDWTAVQRGWGFRIYNTKAGVRLIATHALFEPTGSDTAAAFAALGADPLYAKLCLRQSSFRARLTPKPWRCGIERPPSEWPFEPLGYYTREDLQERFQKWNAKYTKASESFASSHFLGAVGESVIDERIAPIVEIHDRISKAASDLPLA